MQLHCVLLRACKEGLQRAYRSGGDIRSIVKKLIALALLPSNRAYEAFQTIRHRTENALLAENPQSRAGVARLFQYIGGYWFTNQGPERFCVSGDDHRTNNEVESFNRWFNARCGPHHQNFWSFIQHIQEFNENTERDFIAIRVAQQIRPPQRLVNKQRDRNIKTLTEQLTSGAIQIYEFLDVAGEFFEPGNQDQLDRTADKLARPAPENDDLEGLAGIVAEEPAPVHRQPVCRRRLSAENVDEVPAIRRRGRPRRIPIENLNEGNEPLRRPRGRPRQLQIPGGAFAELAAAEFPAPRPRGRPRRTPVAAAAALGVVEPVIVTPAVVEPVIAAPPVVAADHHNPQPAHICDI
ncbi:hypothetical protein OUZ56_009853 [Daphnia magna]|uniref:Integrase catalytic domain-containing protein n=2 Tax=Daphnia magna TaxID=35525 RepID=A0ABR0AH62_9CRUS|nr:hypothetical protein OUZ56_009853 [Daphnia magna]